MVWERQHQILVERVADRTCKKWIGKPVDASNFHTLAEAIHGAVWPHVSELVETGQRQRAEQAFHDQIYLICAHHYLERENLTPALAAKLLQLRRKYSISEPEKAAIDAALERHSAGRFDDFRSNASVKALAANPGGYIRATGEQGASEIAKFDAAIEAFNTLGPVLLALMAGKTLVKMAKRQTGK